MRRVIATAAAALIATASLALAPTGAQAAPPGAATAVAETEAVPELFGIGVRDWCSYGVMKTSPVYKEPDVRSTRTGTLYKGDKVKALCNAGDIVDGSTYKGKCGSTGSRDGWQRYMNSDKDFRYIPRACFEG